MKKINMRRFLARIILMAAFAAGIWPAWGQDQANDSGGEHFRVQDGNIAIRQTGKSWAYVGDATVGTAAKAFGLLYPNATIAADPSVAKEKVPDLIIKAGDLQTEMKILKLCCGSEFDVEFLGIMSTGGQISATNYGKWVNSGAWGFVPFGGARTNASPTDRAIQCFNLTGYLMTRASDKKGQAQEAVKKLQTIIVEAIKAYDPAISPPHFQFYADGPLFIVIGPTNAIEISAKIIHAGDALADHTKP
jgi:hypothetical protein